MSTDDLNNGGKHGAALARRAFLGLVAASPLSCATEPLGITLLDPGEVETKRELVVLERLQPVGFWARVQGSYATHVDFKAKYHGWVVGRRNVEFRVDYDVEQTLEETTPDGAPKVMRFDVKALRVMLGKPDTDDFKRGGAAVKLGGSKAYDNVSSGQVVRFHLTDDGLQLEVVSGTLSDIERKAFMHPFGLAREVIGKRSIIPLFGNSESHAIGGSWEGDKRRAQTALDYLGFQIPERGVAVRATLARLEQVGPLRCQVVNGFVVGKEGTVKDFNKDWRPLETNVRIDYQGVFPRDLDYPCVREEIKATSLASALYYEKNVPVYPIASEEHRASREILELK